MSVSIPPFFLRRSTDESIVVMGKVWFQEKFETGEIARVS